MIEKITSPKVAEPPPGRWSNALRVGNMLFISGTVFRAADGVTIQGRDEYEQAKIIFGKIRHLVEAAGGAMSDVVKMTIYVVNIKKNTEVWRARQEFFTGDFPCSTLVEVRNLATRPRRDRAIASIAPGDGRVVIGGLGKVNPRWCGPGRSREFSRRP
jgi:enamine deaminase RidA (YjgF/YER057c/UK114 family)